MGAVEGERMRWDQLFADLEAQWEAEARRDLDPRWPTARAASAPPSGSTSGLPPRSARRCGCCCGPGRRSAAPWRMWGGTGCCCSADRRPVLVPLAALAAVSGIGERAGTGGIGKRFELGFALRGLSRDRAVVALADIAGAVTTGTIDAVGADCFDLSEHAPDEPRRPENVTGRRLVPFSAVVSLRPA